MRIHSLLAVPCGLVAMVIACNDTTAPDVRCQLTTVTTAAAMTTSPNFVVHADVLHPVEGIGPGVGPYSQCDVWVTVPPATSANAGVTIGKNTAVFVRIGTDALVAAASTELRAGDVVDVWDDGTVVVGSTSGPAGAPVYYATQIVIHR